MSRGFDQEMDRRAFTNAALLALVGGVSVTVLGCAEGMGSGMPTMPTPNPGDRAGSVVGNHGHSAIIASAELNAGNAVTLEIRGAADHPHTVMVTMTELAQIAANQRVVAMSSTNTSASVGTHSHQVIFN